MPTLAPENRPFRAENELMPKEFIKEPDSLPESSSEIPASPGQPDAPAEQPALTSSRAVDFSKLTLSRTSYEVDMLQTPVPGTTGGVVEPLPSSNSDISNSGSSSLLVPSKEVFQPSNSVPIALQAPVLNPRKESTESGEIVIDDYIVLGDTIDQEMKGKILVSALWLRGWLRGERITPLLPALFLKPLSTVIVSWEDLMLLITRDIAVTFSSP